MWPSTKLEDQLPLMEDSDVVLVYGPAMLIDEYGCAYARHWDAPKGSRARNDPVGSILPALVRTDLVVTSTVIARRRSRTDRWARAVQVASLTWISHTWLQMATVGRFARSQRIAGYWRRQNLFQ